MRVVIEALGAFSEKVGLRFPQKMRPAKDAWAPPRRIGVALALALAVAGAGVANAQDKGTLNPKSLPPLANPDDPKTPAKELFGRRTTPAPISAVTHATLPPTPVATAAAGAEHLLSQPSLASASSTPVGTSRTIGLYAKGCLA